MHGPPAMRDAHVSTITGGTGGAHRSDGTGGGGRCDRMRDERDAARDEASALIAEHLHTIVELGRSAVPMSATSRLCRRRGSKLSVRILSRYGMTFTCARSTVPTNASDMPWPGGFPTDGTRGFERSRQAARQMSPAIWAGPSALAPRSGASMTEAPRRISPFPRRNRMPSPCPRRVGGPVGAAPRSTDPHRIDPPSDPGTEAPVRPVSDRVERKDRTQDIAVGQGRVVDGAQRPAVADRRSDRRWERRPRESAASSAGRWWNSRGGRCRTSRTGRDRGSDGRC